MQRDDFEVKSFPSIATIGVGQAGGRLRTAIVTEEILGPVRNGGIASTYYHLAKGLAANGHDVHVLFLKGPLVQDETPEHWVRKYAEYGVSLHYLEESTASPWAAADKWQRRYASAYEWLRDQAPFDVVHSSEWRGGLLYALMAKRLGLAFHDTLFVVKTSSPYVWNRHYQMQPITRVDLLAAAFAEQKCVELADVVVGGSAHLISFMDRIGYRLPEGRVYVQPNIVDFSCVAVEDRRPGPPRQAGDIVRTRDLAFFGRLEARKGLEVFCSAVDLLHERGEVPDSITFLGKWGANLPTQGGVAARDFVLEKAQTWSCPVSVVTDRNQPEALSLLCERDTIAVMPSLIENSSMAVYETLAQRIPFIASAVGGTSELIAEDDVEHCLVEPTAHALAYRLERALRHGQLIARPRFSNAENLQVWYGFHSRVAEMIADRGRRRAIDELSREMDRPRDEIRNVTFAVLVRRGEPLDDLIKGLHEDPPDAVLLGFTDAQVRPEVERARAILAQWCEVQAVDCLGQTAGEALNTLVASQASDALVIAHGAGVAPREGFIAAARQGLSSRPGSLFTTFFVTDATVGMPLGSDAATQVLTSRAYGPEIVAVGTRTLTDLGGFEPYDSRRGLLHELVTRAAEFGHELLVFPEPLLSWSAASEDTAQFASDPLYSYLKSKALIDSVGLAQRKVLLSVLHRHGRHDAAPEGSTSFDETGTQAPRWLVPATWDPQSVEGVQHRRLIVGLDARTSELWLYARGPGDRRLTVRGEVVPADLVVDYGDEHSEEHVTLSTLRVPDALQAGSSYPLTWGLYDGERKLHSLFLQITKAGSHTFTLSGRNTVLSAQALWDLTERRLDACGGAEVPDDPALPSADAEVSVTLAVEAALRFMKSRADADPDRVLARSRELMAHPPPATPVPITPRSGLKPPEDKEGWCAGDWLAGWAWDREDRQRMLHVAVLAGATMLAMVRADVLDPSLDDDVPGRGAHGFRIPVTPDLFVCDELRLEVWETRHCVYRGRLYVDRHGEPMLRRVRESAAAHPTSAAVSPRKRAWWRR